MNAAFRFAAVLGLVCLVVGGCASNPQVLPAGKHEPTTPKNVVIYSKAPTQYELLGTIEVPITPAMKWDEKGDFTVGMDALKAQAAAKGADGLLLIVGPGESDLMAGGGYHGQQYEIPVRMKPVKTAVAKAIYVVKP